MPAEIDIDTLKQLTIIVSNAIKTAQNESKVYTVKEVAEILKTNVEYVYDLKNAGLIQFMKLGCLKTRREELERFLREYEGMDLSDPCNVKPLKKDIEKTA